MNRDDDTRHLIERSTQGDELATDALLAEHLPALVAFIRLHAGAVVRAHESCADVAQSVCLEVLEADLAGFDYRGEAAFRNWLFTRALNKLQNRRRFYLAQQRDRRRTVSLCQPELYAGVARLYAAIGSPSQHAIEAETLERFEAAFDTLSESDRQLVSLSRICGMSNAEMAEQLGVSDGNVRVRLHRALARLGTRMHLQGGEREV